jgi:hypothetical protein
MRTMLDGSFDFPNVVRKKMKIVSADAIYSKHAKY